MPQNNDLFQRCLSNKSTVDSIPDPLTEYLNFSSVYLVALLEAKPNRLLCPPVFTFHPGPYVFNNLFPFLLFLGKAMKLEEQKQDTERQLKALTKQMKVRLKLYDKAKLSFYCSTGFERSIVLFQNDCRKFFLHPFILHSLHSFLAVSLPVKEKYNTSFANYSCFLYL